MAARGQLGVAADFSSPLMWSGWSKIHGSNCCTTARGDSTSPTAGSPSPAWAITGPMRWTLSAPCRTRRRHSPPSSSATIPTPRTCCASTSDPTLCGHTHGGQIIVPFEGPRYAPVSDKRYVSGLNAFGSRHIYTTRGVGNILGVRFGCRPEVSLLDAPLLNA